MIGLESMYLHWSTFFAKKNFMEPCLCQSDVLGPAAPTFQKNRPDHRKQNQFIQIAQNESFYIAQYLNRRMHHDQVILTSDEGGAGV
jgi:hypothetical protein